MAIDGIFFSALTRELKRRLINARIQAIFQPRPDELLFHLRQPGQSLKLLICVHPRLATLHITDHEPKKPVSPPAFTLLLRKLLIPGRIADMAQPPFERVLRIVIEGEDEYGAKATRALVVEIMGRHSNAILLDHGSDRIIDALKKVPNSINRHREILPRQTYVPPPALDRMNPSEADFSDFDQRVRHNPASMRLDKILTEQVMGLSPLAAKEILARADLDSDLVRERLDKEAIIRMWNELQTLVRRVGAADVEPTAVIDGDKRDFWIVPPLTVKGKTLSFPTLSAMLDWEHQRAREEADIESLTQRLSSAVARETKRVERKIAARQAALDEGERADRFQLFGELLTANLHRLPRLPSDAETVEVLNYHTGENVAIPVDPTMSPAENAQDYFRKSQKAKKAKAQAQAQLLTAKDEKAYLESVMAALASASDLTELKAIETELEQNGLLAPSGKRPKANLKTAGAPLGGWRSSDGFAILVGKNNRQNETLAFRVAKPHDLWLHVQAIPGAHVVIRTQGAKVPDRTLREAAAIAALHSKAKNSANIPVDYTECRHVRKRPGAAPGMVIYEHQKTLYVTPDPQLLAALKPL